MKKIHLKKNVKTQKFKRLTPGSIFVYNGCRYTVGPVCYSPDENSTIVFRKNMCNANLMIIARSAVIDGRNYIQFEENFK